MNKFEVPQVLFLGNGVNLSYDGISWSDLIQKISQRNDFDWKNIDMPMPLQAILATNDHIRTSLKENKDVFRGRIETEDQMYFLQGLLALGFDDILTTNYSYELEEAGLSKETLTDTEVTKLMRHTSDRAETHYLLHTYNHIEFEGIANRIWHIHGEVRKPDSMILGHYWYGNLLRRIQDKLDQQGNYYARVQKNGQNIDRKSWVDSFILGDVYVLGFSYGLSEIDLWWILTRKNRENAHHGKLYYYGIQNEKDREKTALLELMGAEVINLGFTSDVKTTPDYKAFYQDAFDDIQKRMAKAKQQ